MSNESIERLLYTHDEVSATDPELRWLKESDHNRIVKELEAEPGRLRAILREQRETIKHWQHHALITSRLLGCIAIDKDIEAAIDALKHQPSLSDAIKEVERLYDEWWDVDRRRWLNVVLERLKSLGTQRED
jgi:hypothetical protein